MKHEIMIEREITIIIDTALVGQIINLLTGA